MTDEDYNLQAEQEIIADEHKASLWKSTAVGISMGWNAAVSGSHSIAIGSSASCIIPEEDDEI